MSDSLKEIARMKREAMTPPHPETSDESLKLAEAIRERLKKTTSGTLVSFDVLHAAEVIEASLAAERSSRDKEMFVAGWKAAEDDGELASLEAHAQQMREALEKVVRLVRGHYGGHVLNDALDAADASLAASPEEE